MFDGAKRSCKIDYKFSSKDTIKWKSWCTNFLEMSNTICGLMTARASVNDCAPWIFFGKLGRDDSERETGEHKHTKAMRVCFYARIVKWTWNVLKGLVSDWITKVKVSVSKILSIGLKHSPNPSTLSRHPPLQKKAFFGGGGGLDHQILFSILEIWSWFKVWNTLK